MRLENCQQLWSGAGLYMTILDDDSELIPMLGSFLNTGGTLSGWDALIKSLRSYTALFGG